MKNIKSENLITEVKSSVDMPATESGRDGGTEESINWKIEQ